MKGHELAQSQFSMDWYVVKGSKTLHRSVGEIGAAALCGVRGRWCAPIGAGFHECKTCQRRMIHNWKAYETIRRKNKLEDAITEAIKAQSAAAEAIRTACTLTCVDRPTVGMSAANAFLMRSLTNAINERDNLKLLCHWKF